MNAPDYPEDFLEACVAAWFAPVAESHDLNAGFRQRMRAVLAVASASSASDSQIGREAAFEAVRKRLCAIPRYSFFLDDDGVVRRVEGRSGNWIEFDAAHELFDPVCVDAAIAAQEGRK